MVSTTIRRSTPLSAKQPRPSEPIWWQVSPASRVRQHGMPFASSAQYRLRFQPSTYHGIMRIAHLAR